MELKNRPLKTTDGGGSDTIYVRGFPKTETDENVVKFMSKIGTPNEVDLKSRARSGEVWAKYSNVHVACETIQFLHHQMVNGSILSVKYELGLDDSGKRIVDKSSHTTVIRKIGLRKEGDTQPTKRQKISVSLNNICVTCKSSGGISACRCKVDSKQGGVSYTSNSICVGETEYPFPSGVYLARVVDLSNKLHSAPLGCPHNDALLRILTDTRSMGNKYAKEISEAMAMADAVQRAISLLPPALKAGMRPSAPAVAPIVEGQAGTGSGSDSNNTAIDATGPGCTVLPVSPTDTGSTQLLLRRNVNVFVLGDGKQPLCAAAVCLHLPDHYTFYSVDPLMMPTYSCPYTDSDDGPCTKHIEANPHFGVYKDRFFPLALLSQDFQVPCADLSAVSIVVSCHSHAPLQEFWDRLSGPKLAVTMACCAEYAELYAKDESNIVAPTDSITGSGTAEVKKVGSKKTKIARVPIQPVLAFNDFEVYSPKRKVHIYFDL